MHSHQPERTKYIVKVQNVPANLFENTPQYICVDNPPVVFENNGKGEIVYVKGNEQYRAPLTDVKVNLKRDQLVADKPLTINLIMGNNLFVVIGKIDSLDIDENNNKFDMQMICDGQKIIARDGKNVIYMPGGKYSLHVSGAIL